MVKVKYTIQCRSGEKEVDGYALKGLAYHATETKDYAVSHLNTGLRLVTFDKADKAKKFIKFVTDEIDVRSYKKIDEAQKFIRDCLEIINLGIKFVEEEMG